MTSRTLGWDFEWRTARARLETVYVVGETGAREGPFLALVGGDIRHQYRLEERDRPVYEALADLAPEQLEENAVPLMAFAAEWGFLGERLEHYSLAPDRWEPLPRPGPKASVIQATPGCFGQRVAAWIFAVRELRDALELWSAWAANDRKVLADRVEIRERHGERIATYLGSTMRKVRAGCFEPVRPNRSQLFHVAHPTGDLRAAGFRLLLGMIERRTGSARIGFEPDRRAPHGAAVVARPASLLEAAWIQLASQVVAGDVARRCPVCGRIFADERAKTGPEKQICSRACISKRYRQRKPGKAKRSRPRVTKSKTNGRGKRSTERGKR